MSTVDNRVVEMQFDDADFTPGIKAAIDSLDQLQQALNLDTSTKGLSAISSTALTVSGEINGMQYAVTNVASSFNALEVAALTVLTNIVNKVTDAGIRIAKSLSIDQVHAGFGEYELKMGSVQTIMAGTGESIEEVNKYLERLNAYADQTIYSFSDMTANIGKFTNAGVKLDVAVNAIQGVSNLAALSGANANEASRAMYNFAQALSAGYVKLIDWKSIENANMATVEFKKQLIQTALELGTIKQSGDKYVTTTTNLNGKVSEAFDATTLFNDSLSYQWMTTDVLTTTLARYTDQTTEIGKKASRAAIEVTTFSKMMDALKESIGSGWATSFEKIFGNFEEAKIMWTDLSQAIEEAIGPIGDWRNEMLSVWRDAETYDGRAKVIQGIGDSYAYLSSIFSKFAKGFDNAFHLDQLGDILGEASVGFSEFAKGLEFTQNDADLLEFEITGIAQGLKGFADLVVNVWRAFFGGLFDALSSQSFVPLLEPISAALNRLYNAMRMSSDQTDDLRTAFSDSFGAIRDVLLGLGNVIAFVIEAISPMVKAFNKIARFEGYTSVIKMMAETFYNLTKSLRLTDEQLKGVEDLFTGVFSVLHSIGSAISAVIESIVIVFGDLADIALDVLSPVLDLVGAFLSAIGKNIIYMADGFSEFVKSSRESFREFIKTNKYVEILRTTVKRFATIIGGVAGGLALLVKSLKLGDAIKSFITWIDKAKNKLSVWFDALKQTEAVQTFLGFVSTAKDYLQEFFDRAMEVGPLQALEEAVDNVRIAFQKLQEEESLAGSIARGIQSAIDGVAKAIANIKAKIDEISQLFEKLGISEGIRKMIDGVKELDVDKFSEGFSEFATGVGTLFTDYIIPSVEQGLQDIKTSVTTFFEKDFFETIKSFFSIDELKKRFSDLGEQFTDTTIYDSVTSAISGFIDGMLGVFGIDTDAFDSAAETFWWFISGLFTPIGNFTSILTGNISNLASEASQVLSDSVVSLMDQLAADMIDNPGETLRSILGFIIGGEFVSILGNLTSIMTSVKKFIDSAKGVFNGIGKMFKGIGRMFKGIGRAFDAAAVLEIAVAILLVAKAMKTIAEIDPDRLMVAVEVVAGITAAMGALLAVMLLLSRSGDKMAPGDGPADILKNIFSSVSEGLKGFDVAAMGLGVAAIAGAVLILVFAVKKVAEMLQMTDPKTLLTAAGAMIALFVLMIAAVKLLGSLSNGAATLGGGLGILAVAIAVRLLVGVLDEIMTMLDNPKFSTALTYLGGMVLFLGLMMTMLANALPGLEGGFGTFLGIGLAFILIAVSLKIVVSALRQILDIVQEEGFAAGFTAIVLLMAMMAIALVGIAESLNTIQGGLGTFIGIGIAFVMLAAAIMIVTQALRTISDIVAEGDISTALGALLGIMLVMALSLAGISAVAGALHVGAGQLIAIGVAFVLIGAAMLIVSKAIATISEATTDVAVIQAIATALGALLFVMGLFIALAGAMSGGAAGMLVGAISMVLLSAAMLILSEALSTLAAIPYEDLVNSLNILLIALAAFLLGAGIVGACAPMAAGLALLSGALLATGEAVKLFGEGADLLSMAVIRLSRVKSDAFDGLIDAVHKFLDEFTVLDAVHADDLANSFDPLVNALDRLSDVAKKLNDAGMYSVAAGVQRLLKATQEYQGAENIQQFIDFMVAIEQHIDAFVQFAENGSKVNSAMAHISDTIPKLVESETSFIDSSESFITTLSEVASGFSDFVANTAGVSGALAEVSSAMSNLVIAMVDAVTANSDEMLVAGAALAAKLAEGIEDGSSDSPERMKAVLDTIRSSAETGAVKDQYKDSGVALMTQFVSGMESKGDDSEAAGTYVAERAETAANIVASRFYDVGTNMGYGLVRGLESGGVLSEVYGAAYALALRAKQAAQAALDEHSPSRVFMEIGRFAAQGMAIGLGNGQTMVERASFAMANSAKMIAQGMIDDINGSKYSVYLTPIIDDSQLGSVQSNLLLGGMDFTTMQNAVAAINQNGSSNYDLLMEMRRMHDDLVAVASRPTTAVSIGEVNANDDDSMTDVTRQFVSRLAVLKGGM